jgi:hypothetical protein
MAMTLIEGVITSLKTNLSTNMAAKVTALNAEYADSITLANIAAWYIAEQASVQEYPSVFILGDRSVPEEGQKLTSITVKHEITLTVLATDQNTEALKQRLYRYVRALAEVLNTAAPTLSLIINFDEMQYSPIFAKEGNFLSDATLRVTVWAPYSF